jgi:uroporphyrinogen-III synthase
MSAEITLLRSPDSPDAYLQAFDEAGLSAACKPVLTFSFPNQDTLTERLKSADVHSGCVLTSPRAVEALRRGFEAEPGLKVLWEDKPVFVVGPKTASEVRSLGLTPQAQTAGDAEALVDSIGAVWDEQNLRSPLLFLSGNRRRDTLPNGLARVGIPVTEQVVYNTETRTDLKIDKGTEWLVFFSPSGLESVEASRISVTSYRHAAIGPTTGDALASAGLTPDAVADRPTPSALVEAIKEALGR